MTRSLKREQKTTYDRGNTQAFWTALITDSENILAVTNTELGVQFNVSRTQVGTMKGAYKQIVDEGRTPPQLWNSVPGKYKCNRSTKSKTQRTKEEGGTSAKPAKQKFVLPPIAGPKKRPVIRINEALIRRFSDTLSGTLAISSLTPREELEIISGVITRTMRKTFGVEVNLILDAEDLLSEE